MRGYYAQYGDTIYELHEGFMNRPVVHPKIVRTHMDVSHDMNKKEATAAIYISTLDENGLSNKERYEEIAEKLLTDQTTAIRKLSGLYRVYVEYRLVDVNSNEVVDQGISIKDCKPNAFFFPLGINDENELVVRIGTQLNARIAKRYQSVIPYGLMRKDTHRYMLFIDRLYITQFYASILSVQPVPPRPPIKPLWPGKRPCPFGDKHGTDDDKYMMDPIHHPSMPSTVDKCVTTIKPGVHDCVIVCDTLQSGVSFEPIKINYSVNEIDFTIECLFMDAIIASKDDIFRILKQNVEDKLPKLELPGEGEEPILPEDPDTETPPVDPNPDGSGEDSGEEDVNPGGGDGDEKEPISPDPGDINGDNENIPPEPDVSGGDEETPLQ